MKLVLITEIIAPYRIPVFNALAQRRDIDLQVVFLSETDPTLRQWRIYKEEMKFLYQVLPSWRRRISDHNVLLNRGVRAALQHLEPDVVLCGGYNYLACWQAAYWAKANKKPFILWTESTALDRRSSAQFLEFLKRRFLHLCAAFVVPGESSLAYLKDLGVNESQILTAPNAVDNAMFSELAAVARQNVRTVRTHHDLPARYFLYVGRLIEPKGVFDLLEAYAQLHPEIRNEVGLVFAGNGSQEIELARRARQVTPGSVRILKFLQRDDLASVYALADAFVFPTQSDPWGLVVNEAMACGLPVIISNVAGCALDLARHESNGFLVPPKDIAALRRAMERLAADPALRKEMGRMGRERIDSYSPGAWAQGIVDAVSVVTDRAPEMRHSLS